MYEQSHDTAKYALRTSFLCYACGMHEGMHAFKCVLRVWALLEFSMRLKQAPRYMIIFTYQGGEGRRQRLVGVRTDEGKCKVLSTLSSHAASVWVKHHLFVSGQCRIVGVSHGCMLPCLMQCMHVRSLVLLVYFT